MTAGKVAVTRRDHGSRKATVTADTNLSERFRAARRQSDMQRRIHAARREANGQRRAQTRRATPQVDGGAGPASCVRLFTPSFADLRKVRLHLAS